MRTVAALTVLAAFPALASETGPELRELTKVGKKERRQRRKERREARRARKGNKGAVAPGWSNAPATHTHADHSHGWAPASGWAQGSLEDHVGTGPSEDHVGDHVGTGWAESHVGVGWAEGSHAHGPLEGWVPATNQWAAETEHAHSHGSWAPHRNLKLSKKERRQRKKERRQATRDRKVNKNFGNSGWSNAPAPATHTHDDHSHGWAPASGWARGPLEDHVGTGPSDGHVGDHVGVGWAEGSHGHGPLEGWVPATTQWAAETEHAHSSGWA